MFYGPHERFLGTRLSHSWPSVLKWRGKMTQFHADSPSKNLSFLCLSDELVNVKISRVVVFVCLHRKLAGILKRKENLTHSLTYLCSATYSINGKISRFYRNTSNIVALAQTSLSLVNVQTEQSFVLFSCAKIEKPQNKKEHCLA